MPRGTLFILVAVLICLRPAYGQPSGSLDGFGGLLGPRRAATGFFRVTKAEGRWWLVDPDGYLFLSNGVNGVSLRPSAGREGAESAYREAALAKHRGEDEWAKATVKRLREWGFNTVGPDSEAVVRDQRIAFTVTLNCSRALRLAEGQFFPDVFDPDYERAVRRQAARACKPYAESEWLLGYFTDDQLDWGSERSQTLMGQFLGLADEAPGRRALLGFLEECYLNTAELNDAWATSYESFEEIGRTPQMGSHIPQADVDGFQQLVAGQYFRIASEAVREVDRYHLILGPWFDGEAPAPVLAAANGYLSVISLTSHAGRPSPDHLRQVQRAASCPVLICDFAVSVGGGPAAAGRRYVDCARTEQEQAATYEARMREMMALPMVVGYQWRSYVDEQAAGGRGSCGLVGVDDEPHELLVAAAAKVNSSSYKLAEVSRSKTAATAGAGGR